MPDEMRVELNQRRKDALRYEIAKGLMRRGLGVDEAEAIAARGKYDIGGDTVIADFAEGRTTSDPAHIAALLAKMSDGPSAPDSNVNDKGAAEAAARGRAMGQAANRQRELGMTLGLT